MIYCTSASVTFYIESFVPDVPNVSPAADILQCRVVQMCLASGPRHIFELESLVSRSCPVHLGDSKHAWVYVGKWTTSMPADCSGEMQAVNRSAESFPG